MVRKVLTIAVAVVTFTGLGVTAVPGPSWASGLPSGEVTFGQTVIEPAYDDSTGGLVYLSTPMHVKVHPNFTHNVAPIYLPVYPTGSSVGALNCAHLPSENCPDHGGLIAGLAATVVPSVYGHGVLGHDHLVGIAATGGDFNILWEPVVVLFTTADAANEHVTKLSEIKALEGRGLAFEIALPPATFHCSVVPAAVYARGVPFTG